MRVSALYDVHGNVPALEAVPAEVEREDVDAIVSGGDVVGGHTHHQFDRRIGGVRVVNAGRVGLPYEGRRRAFWALLGPKVELRRTDYDVDASLPSLRASCFPVAAQLLGRSLVDPAPKAEQVAFFESQRR